MHRYQDLLAFYGIGSAHPGGLGLTKHILLEENIGEQANVLDAGCGTGQTAAFLFETFKSKIAAVDHHPIMIEKAKKRFAKEKLPIKLVNGNIERLPFASSFFDIVIAESVTIFTNITKSLKEFYRVLKPGGILINLDMTAEHSLSFEEKKNIDQVYGIKKVPTEEEWLSLLKQTGFQSTQIIYSSSVFNSLVRLPFSYEKTEYEESTNIDPSLNQVWLDHQKLTLLYSRILGYRVYRSIKGE